MKNLPEQVNSFFSTMITTYRQQGQVVKVLIPSLFVLAFCCFCLVAIPLLPSRDSSNALPSPNVFPTEGTQATPTALFGFSTLTPFPTLTFFAPTAFPTLTPSPTGSPTPTRFAPTGTATSVPSATASPVPTATPTNVRSVEIIAVDKPAEYVEIQNFSPAPVNLRGWRLVSETGNQSCNLRGTLDPNEVLRIWARRGNPGFDCRFPNDIWRDNAADPAVLYNAQGEEVSRFP